MKQHLHKCPKCGETFVCRGRVCEGRGIDREEFKSGGDYICDECWRTFQD